MNIFSIHTNKLDRKVLLHTFVGELYRKNILLVYNYILPKVDAKLLNKKKVDTIEYSNPFGDEIKHYDLIICYNLPRIDSIKKLKSDNLLLLSNEFHVPRELANFFNVDKKKIHSFEKEKDGDKFSNNRTYLIREKSKFTSLTSDQLVRFITRDIKLNSLLE